MKRINIATNAVTSSDRDVVGYTKRVGRWGDNADADAGALRDTKFDLKFPNIGRNRKDWMIAPGLANEGIGDAGLHPLLSFVVIAGGPAFFIVAWTTDKMPVRTPAGSVGQASITA